MPCLRTQVAVTGFEPTLAQANRLMGEHSTNWATTLPYIGKWNTWKKWRENSIMPSCFSEEVQIIFMQEFVDYKIPVISWCNFCYSYSHCYQRGKELFNFLKSKFLHAHTMYMSYQKLQSIRIWNSDSYIHQNFQLEVLTSETPIRLSDGNFCHNIKFG